MRLIRAVARLGLSALTLTVLRPAAWWAMRRQRRAIRDMRRAGYLATRAVRTMAAVGPGRILRTASGVPALPPMPALGR